MYLRARQGISYLPQEPSAFRKLNVEDNLYAISETMDLSPGLSDQLVNDLLEEFGIEELRKSPAYTLSGGERRRLEIARALVTSPGFILLDEPFAGIDPLAVLDIQRTIEHLKGRGIGILITDHNVRDTLSITDRAYIIKEGRIFRDGTPVELSGTGKSEECTWERISGCSDTPGLVGPPAGGRIISRKNCQVQWQFEV